MCMRVSLSACASVCVCVQSITFRYKVVVVIVLVDCTGKKRKRVRAPFESEYFSEYFDPATPLLRYPHTLAIVATRWERAYENAMLCMLNFVWGLWEGLELSACKQAQDNVVLLARDSWLAFLVKRVVWVFFPTPFSHPIPLTPRVCSCGTSKFGCPDDYCSSDHWTTIDN